MTFIEGYDPGGSTGYVLGVFDDKTPYTPIYQTTYKENEMFAVIRGWEKKPDRIRVVESFRLLGSNTFTADLTGVGLIKVMKFAEILWPDVSSIVWQTPQDKNTVNDSVLKDSGLWRTGGQVGAATGRHVNDATIHVLAYLKRQRHIPTLDRYWPGGLRS